MCLVYKKGGGQRKQKYIGLYMLNVWEKKERNGKDEVINDSEKNLERKIKTCSNLWRMKEKDGFRRQIWKEGCDEEWCREQVQDQDEAKWAQALRWPNNWEKNRVNFGNFPWELCNLAHWFVVPASLSLIPFQLPSVTVSFGRNRIRGAAPYS